MGKQRRILLALSLACALFFFFTAAAQASAHLHLPFSCGASCTPLSLFVREEHLPPGRQLALPELQEGDILLTDCVHTFGWRHGHAALVVDGPRELVLEAVTVGTVSTVRSAEHWRTYPNAVVLRLKNADPAQRREIALWAESALCGLPYRLTSGLSGGKFPAQPAGGQCAYLIWYAYRQFGWDLDSSGGNLVTVADLLDSPYLETVALLTDSP